ncbi:MAG: tRNA uridine-5-carboxymethylaminomethyl(34) synthesis enzyme MnmG, partial [Alphaproteobacteria bacterium]|nr:tRNA uridine-5-carboxymethylaminomethyl(34) synthesis enzyme MnmG [Alphaproteobacteria bacterium]
ITRSAADILAYPGMTVGRLSEFWPELRGYPAAIVDQIEIDARYAGYLERQRIDIAAFRRDESLVLPIDLNYDRIGGLSTEARGKLNDARPETLGAASRIPGVTPAAMIALLRYVRRSEKARRRA